MWHEDSHIMLKEIALMKIISSYHPKLEQKNKNIWFQIILSHWVCSRQWRQKSESLLWTKKLPLFCMFSEIPDDRTVNCMILTGRVTFELPFFFFTLQNYLLFFYIKKRGGIFWMSEWVIENIVGLQKTVKINVIKRGQRSSVGCT